MVYTTHGDPNALKLQEITCTPNARCDVDEHFPLPFRKRKHILLPPAKGARNKQYGSKRVLQFQMKNIHIEPLMSSEARSFDNPVGTLASLCRLPPEPACPSPRAAALPPLPPAGLMGALPPLSCERGLSGVLPALESTDAAVKRSAASEIASVFVCCGCASGWLHLRARGLRADMDDFASTRRCVICHSAGTDGKGKRI